MGNYSAIYSPDNDIQYPRLMRVVRVYIAHPEFASEAGRLRAIDTRLSKIKHGTVIWITVCIH